MTIISNEEMNDIMKIIKSPEESGLLIKGISETIKNEAKYQKGGAIATSQEREWLETLATRASMPVRGTIRVGKGTIRAGQDF